MTAPAPAPGPLSLMQLASLVDLLRLWQAGHPEDREVGPVLARAETELDALVEPWRVVVREMTEKLEALGFPGAKMVRADQIRLHGFDGAKPITIHGFDGSERIIEGARGEPAGPTWATYDEGTTE